MQRARGVAVLLLALLLLLAVPRLLSAGVPGEAARAPLPSPPAVGACLLGYNYDPVSCDQLHDYEVLGGWAADDPDSPPPGAEYACDDLQSAVWQFPSDPILDAWTPPPVNAMVGLIWGPVGVTQARFRWQACVVMPVMPAHYTGVVVGLTTAADRPGAFGECFRNSPGLSFANPISCTEAHDQETLSYAGGFIADNPAAEIPDNDPPLASEAVLNEQCGQVGALLTGTPDATFQGQLTLAVSFSRDRSTYVIDSGVELTGVYLSAICYAQAPAGRQLTDSVVGLGSAPLPLA